MNEQLPVPAFLTPAVPLPQRAQRIRDLVSVARGCIIEVGHELIAAKAELVHGEWLPWLDQEFGWSEAAAQRYMQVARAFQIPQAEGFKGLTIDATALYALSAPDVPQEARDEAVARAEAGEHVTKREAEEMVAKARAEQQQQLEDKLRAGIEAYQAEEEGRTKAAIKEATTKLRDDKKALAAKIKEIRDAQEQAISDPEKLAKFMARAIGVPKLTGQHYQLLAQILGRGFAVGNKTYSPQSPEELRRQEEAMRMASSVAEAVRELAGAPPPESLLASCYPVQRALIREKLDDVMAWVARTRIALSAYENERI